MENFEDICKFLSENAQYGKDFSEATAEDFADLMEKNFKNCSVAWGATKFVIITDTDYVIKMPFSYSKSSGDFRYAGINHDDWDYVNAEASIYELAKEEGLEKAFASTTFFKRILFGNNSEYPLYLSEKVIPYCDYDYEKHYPADGYDGFFFEKNNIDIKAPFRWLVDCLKWYTMDFLQKLASFIKDCELNGDLRPSNIGYTKEGRPVILDYSGFYEDEYSDSDNDYENEDMID